MNLADLVPYVIMEVPGATPTEVQFKLREAFRMFCMDTEAWEQSIDKDTVDGQLEYSVLPTGDAMVRRVISVQVKGSDNDDFDLISPIEESRYEVLDSGLGIRFINGSEVNADRTDGMRVNITLQPTSTCDSVSDDLIDRYAEVIYAKAKSLLMRMPGKMFFNPDLSLMYEREYIKNKPSAYRNRFARKKYNSVMVNQLGGNI